MSVRDVDCMPSLENPPPGLRGTSLHSHRGLSLVLDVESLNERAIRSPHRPDMLEVCGILRKSLCHLFKRGFKDIELSSIMANEEDARRVI